MGHQHCSTPHLFSIIFSNLSSHLHELFLSTIVPCVEKNRTTPMSFLTFFSVFIYKMRGIIKKFNNNDKRTT